MVRRKRLIERCAGLDVHKQGFEGDLMAEALELAHEPVLVARGVLLLVAVEVVLAVRALPARERLGLLVARRSPRIGTARRSGLG